MSEFSLQPNHEPFARWMGPYSPARGTYSGFRFHRGRLGTWVENQEGREFWPLVDSPGVRALQRIVLDQWGGGRVLLLPSGHVIKALPGEDEVGRRLLIGGFQGSVRLERPGGAVFDLGNPGTLRAGAPWPGPKTTGLECAIRQDGSLVCTWYHPSSEGRETIRAELLGSDRNLAAGFRAARPTDPGGRVRLTANGLVITNRQEAGREWKAFYVGRITAGAWPHQQDWILKEAP